VPGFFGTEATAKVLLKNSKKIQSGELQGVGAQIASLMGSVANVFSTCG